MFIRSKWFIVLPESCVSLLSVSLDVLSFSKNGVLKSPTIVVELFFPFVSVHFYTTCFGVLLLGAYMLIIVTQKFNSHCRRYH